MVDGLEHRTVQEERTAERTQIQEEVESTQEIPGNGLDIVLERQRGQLEHKRKSQLHKVKNRKKSKQWLVVSGDEV